MTFQKDVFLKKVGFIFPSESQHAPSQPRAPMGATRNIHWGFLVSDYPDSFAALFFNVFAASTALCPNGNAGRPVWERLGVLNIILLVWFCAVCSENLLRRPDLLKFPPGRNQRY